MKRKILIVTERRSDYSKLYPILKEIEKSKKLDYFLIVTGTHLLKEHGYTINEIKNDGLKITSKFEMHIKNRKDTGAEMVAGLGNSIIHLSKIIDKLNPDIILAGFDTSANFALTITGAYMNKIVVHMEGGEITGTIDESIRHAITKFAHIHFTTHKQATKRLVKLGENPKHIFTVGNPSLDNIKNLSKISKADLEHEFKIDLKKHFIIIMQHTVTTEIEKGGKNMLQILEAVSELGIQAIIIHGNRDFGSKKISEIIQKSKINQYKALSFTKYVNLLKHSTALVGNSSSGKMEAPFLKIPSINIGTRQKGRLKSKSVLDVDYDKDQIKTAILRTINDKKFLNQVKKQNNLYGSGNSAKKIIKILEELNLQKISIQKKLHY